MLQILKIVVKRGAVIADFRGYLSNRNARETTFTQHFFGGLDEQNHHTFSLNIHNFHRIVPPSEKGLTSSHAFIII